MKYVNETPLNGTITVYTPNGTVNVAGQATGFTKSEEEAAIFKKTKHQRDDEQRETTYSHVIYTADIVDKDALIYLGTTSETDPNEVGAREIKDFSPMEDVDQVIIGYKLWL